MAQRPDAGGTPAVQPDQGGPAATTGGQVRLRQPGAQRDTPADETDRTIERNAPLPPPYAPGEFERFVQKRLGESAQIRRLGAEIVTAVQEARASDSGPLVPDDYLIGPGDEVLVTLWGSVDADLRLPVDRLGRIVVPRVGTVQVAGMRLPEAREVIARRVALVFRNFELSVSLGQLHGIRVFVTGNVLRPGAHTVSSLSTVLTALMRAGGPSAAGTFRQIEVRRGSELLGNFDLYDLLVKGDRAGDRILRTGDVVHVGPVGTQVAVLGSVNRPAIVELRPGETAADSVRLVGGFSAVADRERLAVERLADRNSGRVIQVSWAGAADLRMASGDVVTAFSAVDAVLPKQQQSKRVRVEGEVARPGEYVLPASSSVADALRAAGGLTTSAYVFAMEFERESVRMSQQENYDRALRDLETDIARAGSSQRLSNAEEVAGRQASQLAQDRLIARLRALRPSGRIVMQVAPDARELPDLALEDGDRIFIPSKPTTIGVFGSVFNAASYLYLPGRTLEEYLRLAGGPTKGADQNSVFVVRANGNVLSNRQGGGFLRRGRVVEEAQAEPGDTIFVPEELDKTTFVQAAKDWTQILYQFGIGLAGIKSAIR